MAIKITDNFQVNIKNPIDNRFVVGSPQSIPGSGSIYPTPFYAYRDDISSNYGFVYPGLRIWDFNDNLPYVWTGTTWSNENLTGASVLNGGGYQNYITKFHDTSTVLTKSLLFDNYQHISLGNVGILNPNNSEGLGIPPLNNPASSITEGLQVKGRIRTNTGFVGKGSYISNINAQNIDGGPAEGAPGRLQLPFIATNSPYGSVVNNGGIYVLTSRCLNPSDPNPTPTTSWQPILNVVPEPTQNWKITNIGSGVSLYKENNIINQYEFFSLISTGFSITDGINVNGNVRLELNAQSVGTGTSIYKGLVSNSLNLTKNHEFRKIKSDTLSVSIDTSDNLTIDYRDFPLGGIIMWSGTVAPSRWRLCVDGIGTVNGIVVPNLSDRFVVGTGNLYTYGATAGSKDAVVVSHSHGGNTDSGGIHSHLLVSNTSGGSALRSVTPAPTGQYLSPNNNRNERDEYNLYGVNTPADRARSSDSVPHTHTIPSDGVSGTDKNLPPYYALAFIIYVGIE